MNKWIVLVLSFFSFSLLANEFTPEQQRIFDESMSVEGRIKNILQKNSVAGLTFLKIPDAKMDNTQNQEMRDFFRNFGFDPAITGYDILIGLSNDHNAFTFGLIPQRGDDFGYTHGLIIQIGATLNEVYHVKFHYSSDLYSKPIDGEIIKIDDKGNFKVRQYVANDNIVKFVLDNYDEGKLFYWRGELGWHHVSHDPDDQNLLLGSTQQLRFHKLLNSIKPGMNMIPESYDDGIGDQNGILMGLMLGTSQTFGSSNHHWRLRFNEEAGVRYSGATHYTNTQQEVKATLTHSRGPKKIAFEIGVGIEVTQHDDGVEYNPFIDLGLGKARKWRLGVRADYYHGDIYDPTGYNLINPELGGFDPVGRIYYQYFTK